jgi:hypothetical protein
MERYVELNDGENGKYFFGDTVTGAIYASNVPLSEVRRQYPEKFNSPQGLGEIVTAIVGFVAAATPAVIGAVNASKNRKAAEKAAAQEQLMLQQHAQMQAGSQASQQQMVMMIGGVGLAGFLIYMLLK